MILDRCFWTDVKPYTMTLFDPTPEPAAWVLWRRESRRHKWRIFAQGDAAAPVLATIRGKGDWMLIGPEVYDPNVTTLAEVQTRAAVPATF